MLQAVKADTVRDCHLIRQVMKKEVIVNSETETVVKKIKMEGQGS